MTIKIRKELHSIVNLHNRVIQALKVQKVRQDQILERYGEDVENELEIPSNRFLNWSRVVRPYLDSVVSSKLMDFELIQQYEKFLKEVIEYEGNYIITEDEIGELEYGFDQAVENNLKLEKKMLEVRAKLNHEITKARLRAIELYQNLPEEERTQEGTCVMCGQKLDPEEGDEEEECYGCAIIPEDKKPFRSKLLSEQNQEEEDKEEEGFGYVNEEENDEEEDDKEQEEEKINDSEEKEEENKPEGETKKDRDLRKQFNKLMEGYNKKRKEQEDSEEIE
jgi:hypothetical protein